MSPGGSAGGRTEDLWSRRPFRVGQHRGATSHSRGHARARRGVAPGDAGMTTAEYALGTVAACGFAAVLWAVVHSGAVHHLVQSVVERALNLPF